MSGYDLSDFSAVPEVKDYVTGKVKVDQLPSIDDVRSLATWTTDMTEVFNKTLPQLQADSIDRSGTMAWLAYSGAELGWSDEQITAMLYDVDTRWEKYVARHNRETLLLDILNRAREKVGYVKPDEGLQSMISAMENIKELGQSTVEEPRDNGIGKLLYGFTTFVESDIRIDWEIPHLLAKGGIGLFTGYPGTGKTQVMVNLAAHLALGWDFLGWEIPGPKRVLFLSLEMSEAPMHLFSTTIAGNYIGDEEREELEQKFIMAPLGKAIPLDTEDGQKFVDLLLDYAKPDVVIIDSLQKIVSKELTDELAVKNLTNYLQNTRNKYGCSMVIIHHNRKKSNERQKVDEIELSDMYGSTYLAADADFVLSLKVTDQEDDLSLDTLKNRLGKARQSFLIHRNEHLGFTELIQSSLVVDSMTERKDTSIHGESKQKLSSIFGQEGR